MNGNSRDLRSLEERHTAGPWVYGRDSYVPNTFWIGQNYGEVVCRVTGRAAAVESAESNARLIAAAPDLLAALIAITAGAPTEDPGFIEFTGNADDSQENGAERTHYHLAKIARAAIAKAEGQVSVANGSTSPTPQEEVSENE